MHIPVIVGLEAARVPSTAICDRLIRQLLFGRLLRALPAPIVKREAEMRRADGHQLLFEFVVELGNVLLRAVLIAYEMALVHLKPILEGR